MSEKNHPNSAKGTGFLGKIENLGNKLPHPVVIFVLLALLIIVISEITARAGVNATYFDPRTNEQITTYAISLMNKEGIAYLFNNATSNFTGFAPLGTVLVAMLGVGVAEWTGLIGDTLKKLIRSVPTRLLTAVVVLAGIVSNIASDAGYVVVIPLGAIVFAGAGRHPIAGLAAAFAGVSGGFSANLIIGPTDALLTGITNAALESANIDYTMSVTGNWYFMIVSTFILTIVGTWVTTRIIEPRLGEYKGEYMPDDEPLTDLENKGLRNAGIALVLFILVMGILLFPENGALRALDETTGQMTMDYFLGNGLIFAIFFLFAIPGLVYGLTIGKIKDSNDFVESMTQSMKSMGSYIVLAFFAAQFINYFSYTNLGTILSVDGAEFLENIGFKGLPLVISFIVLAAFLDLFMGSASAKWAIMAPIFVPMMFKLGLTPELTQIAYRIADSVVNIITPLMSYFAMILVFMKRYDKRSGLGTLISTMLPYSIAFFISWVLLLIIWYFTNIPVGPDAYMHFR
ncbi:AbgT family transporter [Jeotgalibaca ciconiae]|uniref:AbgT family transporter n=1 Tax=Jeotgalibaca ciconiae TaxID=2496265 RepID=A0A3S9H7Z7_9LACT|nr:AbgT family transporter [Jeotgalibaca ciconiae]AZP03456.1 AbgT family transporter [Jeotgalibaca ciconiae]